MREKLATVSSDKASLQTKLGKNALANEELEKSAKKKQQQISTLIEARGNLESVLKVKQEQVIKLEKALEQAQANEEEVTFHIKEVNSKYRKLELDYAASVEKVELFELVISQKDKVASDLLEALKEMMSSSDERDEELAVLTDENNELVSKLDEANVKISRMHSKMQGLRMERNNAIARMQGLISGNSSLLETKVKEVSTRLDAEFAELQQRVESLDADMAELKSKNKCLEKENAVLRDSKKVAEERIAALEEAKVKRVKFSATCAPPAAGGPFGNGGKIRPISPASSYTSSSGFFDAEVAEQVAKALELAKQKLNKDKGSD
jgi:DNA repair exonuclease SbcCD ATPase subunit